MKSLFRTCYASRCIKICLLFFTIVISVSLVTVSAARGDDELNALVAEYSSYGLPHPSDQAKLAIMKWSEGTVNNIPQFNRSIVFLEPSADGKSRFWFGCQIHELSSRVTTEWKESLLSDLEDTSPEIPSDQRSAFESYSDLTLAIQCAARGWSDLALALRERSRHPSQTFYRPSSSRLASDREVLAMIAWNYWCEAFCREKGGREKIVARLKDLCDRAPGLDTHAHRNILSDMRRTLEPSLAPKDSIEAMVDSLIDLGIDGDREGELGSLSSCKYSESYRSLKSLGLEAVPVLLQHTHDFRMTHCIQSHRRGPWIVRIADVVCQILQDLAKEKFAYDLLVREGRGQCIDRDHVRFWWSETKGIDASAVLRDNAIKGEGRGKLELNPPKVLVDEAFVTAVRSGNLAKVKSLVEANPALVTSSDGRTPLLYVAVHDARVDVARFLLDHGADVNVRTGHNQTPLFAARSSEMARLLVERGATMNIHVNHADTPLRQAVRNHHLGVVNVLLEAGEKLDDLPVELGDTELVKEMLLKKPWLAKPPRKPLFDAAEQDNLELTKLLLSHGADPDMDYGFANVAEPYTPLSSAVTSNHFEIAATLLEHGASPNVSGGRNHDNLFLFAIAYLDSKYTKLMLDHGADTLGRNSNKYETTPLLVACSLGGAESADHVGRVGQPQTLNHEESQALQKAKYMVEAGADVNAKTFSRMTPLLGAALASNESVCEFLLANGAKIDLASACMLGRLSDVKSLLNERPELATKKEIALQTPLLHWAVRGGDVSIVEYVLDLGGEIDARAPELRYEDASGFSPDIFKDVPSITSLHIAASLGYEPIVRLLLERGANAELNHKLHSAFIAACDAEQWGVVRLLLELGQKPSSKLFENYHLLVQLDEADLLWEILEPIEDFDFHGKLASFLLSEAIRRGKTKTIERLMERGTQLDIFSACELGRIEDVRLLIESDPMLVNAHQNNYPKMTVLEIAVRAGSFEIVQYLMEQGADQKAKPMLAHIAANSGHRDVLKLVSQGGTLNAIDENGATLLHAAAAGLRPKVVQYLIEQGLDANARDFGRSTPLCKLGDSLDQWGKTADVDALSRATETAKLLIEAGADVNVMDRWEATPIRQAASKGFPGVAKLLIEQGANVNHRDDSNVTALRELSYHFRSKHDNQVVREVEKVLLEAGAKK